MHSIDKERGRFPRLLEHQHRATSVLSKLKKEVKGSRKGGEEGYARLYKNQLALEH